MVDDILLQKILLELDFKDEDIMQAAKRLDALGDVIAKLEKRQQRLNTFASQNPILRKNVDTQYIIRNTRKFLDDTISGYKQLSRAGTSAFNSVIDSMQRAKDLGIRDAVPALENLKKQFIDLTGYVNESGHALDRYSRSYHHISRKQFKQSLDLTMQGRTPFITNYARLKDKNVTALTDRDLVNFAKAPEGKKSRANFTADFIGMGEIGEIKLKKLNERIRNFNSQIKQAKRQVNSYGIAARLGDERTRGFVDSIRNLTSASVLVLGPLSALGARIAAVGSIAARTNLKFALLVGAAAALGLGLTTVIRQVFTLGVELDKINQRLQVTEKISVLAGKTFNWLRELAHKAGASFVDIAKGFSRINIAATGTNLVGNKIREIFTNITFAATKMNLSSEETAGVLKAVEQIMSKGIVQAEELRGQLGDRLPGAVNIMARAIGVSTGELTKLLKRGQITSDFLHQFSKELAITYGADINKNIETAASSLSRLKNSWFDLFAAINDVLGVTKGVVIILDGISDSIRGVAKNIDLLVALLYGLGTAAFFKIFTGVIKGILNINSKLSANLTRSGRVAVSTAAGVTVLNTSLSKVGRSIKAFALNVSRGTIVLKLFSAAFAVKWLLSLSKAIFSLNISLIKLKTGFDFILNSSKVLSKVFKGLAVIFSIATVKFIAIAAAAAGIVYAINSIKNAAKGAYPEIRKFNKEIQDTKLSNVDALEVAEKNVKKLEKAIAKLNKNSYSGINIRRIVESHNPSNIKLKKLEELLKKSKEVRDFIKDNLDGDNFNKAAFEAHEKVFKADIKGNAFAQITEKIKDFKKELKLKFPTKFHDDIKIYTNALEGILKDAHIKKLNKLRNKFKDTLQVLNSGSQSLSASSVKVASKIKAAVNAFSSLGYIAKEDKHLLAELAKAWEAKSIEDFNHKVDNANNNLQSLQLKAQKSAASLSYNKIEVFNLTRALKELSNQKTIEGVIKQYKDLGKYTAENKIKIEQLSRALQDNADANYTKSIKEYNKRVKELRYTMELAILTLSGSSGSLEVALKKASKQANKMLHDLVKLNQVTAKNIQLFIVYLKNLRDKAIDDFTSKLNNLNNSITNNTLRTELQIAKLNKNTLAALKLKKQIQEIADIKTIDDITKKFKKMGISIEESKDIVDKLKHALNIKTNLTYEKDLEKYNKQQADAIKNVNNLTLALRKQIAEAGGNETAIKQLALRIQEISDAASHDELVKQFQDLKMYTGDNIILLDKYKQTLKDVRDVSRDFKIFPKEDFTFTDLTAKIAEFRKYYPQPEELDRMLDLRDKTIEYRDALIDQGKSLQEANIQAVAYRHSLNELHNAQKEGQVRIEFWNNVKTTIEGAVQGVGDAFAKFITGQSSLLDSLANTMRNTATAIISELWRIYFVKKALGFAESNFFGGKAGKTFLGITLGPKGTTSPTTNTNIGNFGIPGNISRGPIVPSAKGNVFNNSNILPFRNGGVIDTPTVFPLKNKTGLMGEAGPEALLPLSRNSRGQLGVHTTSTSDQKASIMQNININIPITSSNNANNDNILAKRVGKETKKAIQMLTRETIDSQHLNRRQQVA